MSDKQDEALEALKERVDQFLSLSLPGQPQMMHMGTSYLVHDLWRKVQELSAALERQRVPEGRDVYIIVHRNGPDCQFVEIETEDGKGVSVPWHTHGGGMHKIGPLRLAAAPEDSDG